MHLKVINQNDKYIQLALSGRLDMAGVREIEIEFAGHAAESGRSIILDMAEVPFLASMGVRMLLTGAKKLHGGGNGRLILVNPCEMVGDVLRMAGVEALLTHADTVADAVDELEK